MIMLKMTKTQNHYKVLVHRFIWCALFASLFVPFVKSEIEKEGSTGSWKIEPVHELQKQKLEPVLANSDSETKVVCYLGNSEWDPEKINADLCSHIVYIYVATLDENNLLIKPRNISLEFQERIARLKEKGIKVLIGLGGWDDSTGSKYSRLVNSPTARKNFVSDVTDFLESSGFDGLELQWQYPSCSQGGCFGYANDKDGYTSWIKELHEAFEPKSFLLSAYVAPLKHEIDEGYNVPEISKYLDWISVMCHSYHGYWNGITGHVAPMYAQLHDYDQKYNTNFSMNYWIEKGADRKKLLMTIPTFGRTYKLANEKNNGLGMGCSGAGEGQGAIPYSKICQHIINDDWTLVRDDKYRVGPYAYSGNQWVSFDDVLMMKYKSEYIKNMGLGGAVIWSLDFEDFDNVCNCESYPLLKTINRVLRNYSGPDPQCYLDIDNNV